MLSRIKSLCSAGFRVALVGIFWIVVRVGYRVKISGLEHATGKHATYYAMAHKRDLDPLIEAPSVLIHRGWQALVGEVRFGLRADAFEPGFLGRIIRSPNCLARSLRVLALGPILRAIGLLPVENVHTRMGEVWIREWLEIGADQPAAAILTAAFLRRMAAQVGEKPEALAERPLSQLLAWHYHKALLSMHTADIFLEPARSRMKKVVLQHVKEELGALSAWLEGGGSLWAAPEGQLSPTGAIGAITDALPRITQSLQPGCRIVPLSIMYDFMTTGCPRVFVNILPALERAAMLDAVQMKAHLRARWLLGASFTCTQLASGFLVQSARSGALTFTLDDLGQRLVQSASKLSAMGRCVDPRLLSSRSAKKLARNFLKYAARHHLVRAAGYAAWIPTIGSLELHVSASDVGYRHSPLAYAWNELQDLMSVNLSNQNLPVL